MSQPTQFEEIYRLFLNSISNDYRLKKMFVDSPEIAEDMLKTWLIKAVAQFSDCTKNLQSSTNMSDKNFGVALDIDEQVILSDLMVYNWMDYNINNIVQMNLSVQDRDFKTHAEERNLAGKSEYQDRLREKIYHSISEYTKKQYPISSWANGGVG